MKDKILIFIIGVLIGAIIASAGFVIYIKTNDTNQNQDFSQNGGTQQGHRKGEKVDNNGGTPPEHPNGEKPSNDGGTPPELPNGEKPSNDGEKQSELTNGENTSNIERYN